MAEFADSVGKEWTGTVVSRKTRLLLKRGWDETNVDEMTEQDLKDPG